MDIQPAAVSPNLAAILNAAGAKSNVDFSYLLQTAMRESSLDPEAHAESSSAVGLFQFLQSTWLEVMKEQGPRLGYGQYADAITKMSDGDYTIADSATRADILKLREDPQIAADLAAAFTASNGAYLKDHFGRMPSAGELYIAHFLGAQGAEKMFTAGLADPDQNAATLFPRQARANRSIFYDHGEARSVKEVYRILVAKHAPQPGGTDAAFAAQQMAATQMVTDTLGLPALGYAQDAPSLSTGLQPLVPPGQQQPLVPGGQQGPLVAFTPADLSFNGLFSTIQSATTDSFESDDDGGAGPFFAHLYGQ